MRRGMGEGRTAVERRMSHWIANAQRCRPLTRHPCTESELLLEHVEGEVVVGHRTRSLTLCLPTYPFTCYGQPTKPGTYAYSEWDEFDAIAHVCRSEGIGNQLEVTNRLTNRHTKLMSIDQPREDTARLQPTVGECKQVLILAKERAHAPVVLRGLATPHHQAGQPHLHVR